VRRATALVLAALALGAVASEAQSIRALEPGTTRVGRGRMAAMPAPAADATPAIPGAPYAFYEAARETAYAGGDPVSSATDQSGNARHLTQATTSLRPTYRSTCAAGKLGDLPCYDFPDGTDWLSRTAGSTLTQPTLICGVVMWESGSNAYVWDGVAVGSRHGLLAFATGTAWSGFAGSVFSGATYSASRYDAVCVNYNGASSAVVVNGSSTAGSAGTHTLTGFTLGGNYAGASLWRGRVLAVGLWRDGTTAGSVLNYFTARFGALPQS
jgi:hypothetical protein